MNKTIIYLFISLSYYTCSAQLPSSSRTIKISEILFNPKTNGSDFIELHQTTQRSLVVSGKLCRIVDGEQKNCYRIPNVPIDPMGYIVLTGDTLALKQHHPNAIHCIQTKIPPMNNNEGRLVLLSEHDSVLDSIYYHESYHFSLITDVEGVSLERIADSPWNQAWHSAASNVGYATPGFANSQQTLADSKHTISLLPAFSPDQDGQNDLLVLSHKLPRGYVLNAYIYNLHGVMLQQIANNQLLGTSGTYTWDGILSNGEKINIGHYILLAVAYHPSKKTQRKKLPFAVIGSF